MNLEPPVDKAQLQRRVTALTSERTALFNQAGSHVGGLEAKDQTRLGVVERELDECFNALRRARAVRDADRFSREDPALRRRIPRPPAK